VVELPQPWPMTLVDVKLWILKLFRLHPETQDLHIVGFFKEYCYDEFLSVFGLDHDPEWYFEMLDWKTCFLFTDKCWTSFVNKMKRKNLIQQLTLYVDSAELKHYDVLLKAVPDGYSQLATVVMPSDDENLRLWHILEDHELTMTVKEISADCADTYGKQVSLPDPVWRAKQKALEFRFGTYYDSYYYVPLLLKNIVCSNPGSFLDIKDTDVVGCKDFRGPQLYILGTCTVHTCLQLLSPCALC